MRADALAEALRRSDGPTIVCAQAGNVNTGAFDPLPEIAEAAARGGRVAPRRRRLRPLGRRQPALSPPRRGGRPRRLLGDRRAQVAQRAVRLRARLHAAPGRARRGDGARRQLSAAERRTQPVRLGPRGRRGAREASPCGPPCARSDGAASPSSSSAAASMPARSPSSWRRSRRSRSSTMSSSTRSSCASVTTTRRRARSCGACRRTAPAGSAEPCGRARRRCASPSPASAPRATTSAGPRTRSSQSRPASRPRRALMDALRLTADYAAQFLAVARRAADTCVRVCRGAPRGARRAAARTGRRRRAGRGGAHRERLSPVSSAIPSGRYFGFVIGGALPAALAADWLTSTWDQNAGLVAAGPSAAVVEEVVDRVAARAARAARTASSAGFVTGCQMAHVTALRGRPARSVARGRRLGCRCATGSPARRRSACSRARSGTSPSTARLGCSASATRADRGGLGRRAGTACVADRARGRALDRLAGRRSSCAQAGNVNTGAFDPLDEIADARRATPARGCTSTAPSGSGRPPRHGSAHLVAGAERADSWATDAHKWLNVPYDSGIAFCAASGSASGRDGRHAPATSSRSTQRQVAIRWTGRRSSRGGRAASPIYAAIRVARPAGHRRARRALLRPRAAACRAPGRRRRRRDPERRRSQPGARPVRRRRRSDARGRSARAGRRHVLALGDDVAGTCARCESPSRTGGRPSATSSVRGRDSRSGRRGLWRAALTTACASRLEPVGQRLELRRLAAGRMRERLREQPVGEPRVARQQRPVQVRADRPADAAALEAGVAVVAEPGDDAAERRRARHPGACGRRGSRSRRASAARPGSSSHSSRTSPIIRRVPATVSCGKRPTPGMSTSSRPK